jgi:hypothetical protein
MQKNGLGRSQTVLNWLNFAKNIKRQTLKKHSKNLNRQ